MRFNKGLAIAAAFLLTGCNLFQNISSKSGHNFASEWKFDDEKHWHECLDDGCEEVNESGNHTWDEGVIDVEATKTTAGNKKYTCTVCGKEKNETIPATGDAGVITVTTDLTKTYDIHTTEQENYLSFTGDYYNITESQLKSYGISGTSEKSFPNPVTLAWEHLPAADKKLSYYSVSFGQNSDLSDGYDVRGTTSKSISLYNVYLGNNYFKVMAHYADGSTDSTDIQILKVNEQAPRNLKLGNLSNCRDIGGRTTYNGGKVRQGLLFRTAEPTSDAKEEMVNHLGVKTEIYVKDGGKSEGTSSSALGSSVYYYNCSMDYGTAAYSNLSRNAERLRKVFSILAKSSNYPVFYHCRIGTDRTGLVGILSNGVLGIPFNEVLQDYGFSNFGKIDGLRYAHKASDPNGDDCSKYIDEILKLPGNNFQEQCYNALRSIGVPQSDLDSFINIMVEGNKPNNAQGQIFTTADKFTLSSTSLSSASDYKNPEKYAAISSGKSVKASMTTEAKKYALVIYVGNSSNSTSKNITNGLSVTVNGQAITVPSINHQKAGFGNPGNRTAYMFQVIGEITATAGNTEITVSGKNSDTYNMAGIHLIPITAK